VTFIVYAGSVGRPKDGNTRACDSIIDNGDPFRVEFRRVKYTLERVAQMMEQRSLQNWLVEYLRHADKIKG
jgi:hypothetical protein